jgi:phenylalanyl-tRNA synthetase beta subunit
MLATVTKNRYHFPALAILELGSVFARRDPEDREFRHVGLVMAQRGKRTEADLYSRLKGAVEGWAWDRFARRAEFVQTTADPKALWEHPSRTAEIRIDGAAAGRISVIDLTLRRAMDEHLSAWGVAWAELRLSGLEELANASEPLDGIPEYPLVEMDFTILVPRTTRYEHVAGQLASFDHPLLKRIRYVAGYEGDAIPPDRRSLTFRTVIGDDTRTLVDDDVAAFRREFESRVARCGYELRS